GHTLPPLPSLAPRTSQSMSRQGGSSAAVDVDHPLSPSAHMVIPAPTNNSAATNTGAARHGATSPSAVWMLQPGSSAPFNLNRAAAPTSHLVPPMGAAPIGSAATTPGGGESPASIALTPSGHKLPPLPSAAPRSNVPTSRLSGSSSAV